ncbi:protein of unknown function (plasmid) [Azospirillum baldaniorum]|uniref:Uncharacterized protein n=1 Tax=Azospirillum baldaniorum TaxID=1064539 RepID=A0A9P1JU06_9PROT|nr:protein of unknown function [Azospirillum baldaniorum]
MPWDTFFRMSEKDFQRDGYD